MMVRFVPKDGDSHDIPDKIFKNLTLLQYYLFCFNLIQFLSYSSQKARTFLFTFFQLFNYFLHSNTICFPIFWLENKKKPSQFFHYRACFLKH